MRQTKDYISLCIKGFVTGMVNMIPGVSLGTVAFITGIYSELIASLAAIDSDSLRLLVKFRLTDFWKKINGNFLMATAIGVVTSILFLAKSVNYLILHYSISIGSLLFGLILIVSVLIFRGIKKWNVVTILFLFLGFALTYWLSILQPLKSPDNYFIIFVAGVIAAFCIMTPGLSGTLMLMIIGKFQFMENAYINSNINIITTFILGVLVGTFGASRLLKWALDNYCNAALALISGLMLGSLNKLWPWRDVIEYVTNSKGEQVPLFDKSVLPWNYFSITGKDPLIFQAVFMMALGIFLIVLLEKVAERIKTKI